MRAPRFPTFLIGCLAFGALPFAAAGGMQPLPDEVAPQAPIPTPSSPAFSSSETRLPGGRVTEIEVNTGGSHYYLQPQTPTGSARESSARTTQWNILNFDTRRPASSAPAPEAVPVPPPPRAD